MRTSSSYWRWGGWLLLIGGILSILTTILGFIVPGPLGPEGPPPVWLSWLGACGGLLLVGGLPILYPIMANRQRVLALVGLIALALAVFVGLVVLNVLPAIAFANFTPSATPTQGPPTPPIEVIVMSLVANVLLLVGAICYGLAILRSRAFPTWTAWVLILGSVLSVASFVGPDSFVLNLISEAGNIIAIAILTWLGYQATTRPNTAVEVEVTRPSSTAL